MPERTCSICRKREAKDHLLRFVVEGGEGDVAGQIVIDLRQTLPGRGFYSHSTIGCLLAKRFDEQLQRAARAGGRKSVPNVSALSLVDDALKRVRSERDRIRLEQLQDSLTQALKEPVVKGVKKLRL